MSILGIGGWDWVILLLVATFLIGPDRLPEYVAKLRGYVGRAREMADGAKSQLKDQMGPEFQDVDWRQYDPRQYDPRKIVREALFDAPSTSGVGPADVAAAATPGPDYSMAMRSFDPDRATPFDIDAT